MKVEFFTNADFEDKLETISSGVALSMLQGPFISVTRASQIANAKLEREGIEVDAVKTDSCGGWYTSNNGAMAKTHTALLINIQPIKKCEHPKEKVNRFWSSEGKIVQFECQCGTKVEPLVFGEVK